MPAIFFVRIKTSLDPAEVDRRLHQREPRFRDVPGLLQKVYGREPGSSDVCGIYCFESASALDAFRDSELARSIPKAYDATEVRGEVYRVLFTLWPDRGPFGPGSSG